MRLGMGFGVLLLDEHAVVIHILLGISDSLTAQVETYRGVLADVHGGGVSGNEGVGSSLSGD